MNENFDTKAATWDQNQRRVLLAKTIADFILDNVSLEAGFSLLDYGCGTGLVGFNLAESAGSVCFADTSEGMLAEVIKKAAELKFENIEVKNFDIMSGAGMDKKFDLVVTAMTMHHINEAFLAVEKLTSLLNPGGWIAIADICTEDGSFHQDCTVEHNGFEPAEIVSYLKNLGFTEPVFDNIFEISRNDRLYPVFCICARKK